MKKLICIILLTLVLTGCESNNINIPEPVSTILEADYSNLDNIFNQAYNQITIEEFDLLYDQIVLLVYVDNTLTTKQISIHQLLMNQHKEAGTDSTSITSSCSSTDSFTLNCSSLDELPAVSSSKETLTINEFIDVFTSISVGDLETINLEEFNVSLDTSYYIYSLIEYHDNNEVELGETNTIRIILEKQNNTITPTTFGTNILDGYYLRIDIRETEQYNSDYITFYYKLNLA
jgi:hypothetical protein